MSLGKGDYGGGIVSNTNFFALKELEHYELFSVGIVKNTNDAPNFINMVLPGNASKFSTAINNILGFAGQLNNKTTKNIKYIIDEFEPDIVYLDSSLLGCIASYCKKKHKTIQIITFFHNIEFDFEIARIMSGLLHFFPSLISTTLAEYAAVRYSDKIIALHEKDSFRLEEKYGRKADYIVPVCIKDTQREKSFKLVNEKKKEGKKLKVGFIGTAFFANVESAKIISQYIAPKVEGIANFYICGNGFEKYKALNSTNVNVSGYIDSLDDFYNEMDVMIFPIFSGAGMKVKIAESLMYNKPILASAFALVGYEKIIDGTNVISCESHESFVYHIRQFRRDNSTLYNRESYYKYFSDKACLHYFRNILREIVNNE